MKSVCVTCPSCGAQLDVDLKTKSAICEFCNRKVVLTADDLASSEVVENNIQLAKGAFFDRDMKNAEIHAGPFSAMTLTISSQISCSPTSASSTSK